MEYNKIKMNVEQNIFEDMAKDIIKIEHQDEIKKKSFQNKSFGGEGRQASKKFQSSKISRTSADNKSSKISDFNEGNPVDQCFVPGGGDPASFISPDDGLDPLMFKKS